MKLIFEKEFGVDAVYVCTTSFHKQHSTISVRLLQATACCKVGIKQSLHLTLKNC